MNLSEQVISIELAKKLKELNVKQDSLFYWLNVPEIVHMKLNDDGTIFYDENNCTVLDRIEYKTFIGSPIAYNVSQEDTWSAFTVAELGELIPSNYYNFYKNENGYIFSINGLPNTSDPNVANAMAKMLIYLIENKLVNSENDNKNL